MPSEFKRKPRELKKVKRYKATEFRQFLIYTGPVALKGVLSDNLYSHFLLLSSATYILLSNKAADMYWNNIAKEFLNKFAEGMSKFYGGINVVYNVHSIF